MTQTQNPGTGTPNQTETDKKEEGAHMTTKSMQMSRSSNIHSHAETKKVTREEEQHSKTDDMQLVVDCRICADDIIFQTLGSSGFYNQLGMIAETASKTIRSLILRAADRIGCSPQIFENTCMELFIRFSEPETFFRFERREEEEDGKN